MRIGIAALSALLVAAGAAWWWLDGAAGARPRPRRGAVRPGRRAGVPGIVGLRHLRGPGRQAGRRAGQLAGTEPDGELRVDDHGDLVVTEGVRRRFDYFLSALGEEDLNVLRGRVAAHLDTVLPPGRPARRGICSSAIPATGRRCASWRVRTTTPPPCGAAWKSARPCADAGSTPPPGRRSSVSGPLRPFCPGPPRGARGPSLSAAEKAARVEELEAGLPPDVREMVAASRRPVSVATEVARLREQGASEARVYQLRERELGAEAAERLADLDRRRAEWQRRYDEYREQRRAILDSGLAPADRDAQVEALRARLFDERERRRVEALDRIR
ncbi:hypothetical protein HML84_01130 [Alcanivorax sp. IO_7]|nr:hypothetical protein HML84_01130 [Alcanivorax sp. IO_7]